MPIEQTSDLQDQVAELVDNGELLAIAWSGGKDSTAVLLVALEGYRKVADRARREGRRPRRSSRRNSQPE